MPPGYAGLLVDRCVVSRFGRALVVRSAAATCHLGRFMLWFESRHVAGPQCVWTRWHAAMKGCVTACAALGLAVVVVETSSGQVFVSAWLPMSALGSLNAWCSLFANAEPITAQFRG